MRFGIAGYGQGGRLYHAPFIEAAGHEVVGVVTRSPERRAQLAQEIPGARAVGSLDELLALGVDAVTITTPPHTHRDLVIQALRAGVPVVEDKPFAPDVAGAKDLIEVARQTGTPLAVYHNRRWDGDFLTVERLLSEGALGTPWRLHFSFDLDEAYSLETGPNGGLLRDLGSHVIDEGLALLGPAERVTAWLDEITTDERTVDAGFAVTIEHAGGATSHLSASKLNHLHRRGWQVYGAEGSFLLSTVDVQSKALMAGRRPADEKETWGRDDPQHWGTLRTAAGERRIETMAGDYAQFYRQFGRAVETGTEVPVTPESALRTVQVLQAARLSAETHQTIEIGA